MALVSSLPSRPMTDDELYGLHTSGKFAAVTPINAVTDPDKDRHRTLVIGAIFATEKTIVAAQYYPEERSWTVKFQEENKPESRKGPEGIVDEVFDEAEAALEAAAEEMQSEDVVGKVLERDDDGNVEAAIRDAEDFGELLQKQFDSAM